MPPDIDEQPLVLHCRSLPGTTEDVKWVDNLVFSVGEKMYAVFDLEQSTGYSFKADPLVFEGLTRQEHIVPAPYLARHHWVKVEDHDVLPLDVARDLLTDAHQIVASKLPKKTRAALGLDT